MPTAENDARARAVVAAVNLAEAWVEFWDAVKALGEATRVIPPGQTGDAAWTPADRSADDTPGGDK